MLTNKTGIPGIDHIIDAGGVNTGYGFFQLSSIETHLDKNCTVLGFLHQQLVTTVFIAVDHIIWTSDYAADFVVKQYLEQYMTKLKITGTGTNETTELPVPTIEYGVAEEYGITQEELGNGLQSPWNLSFLNEPGIAEKWATKESWTEIWTHIDHEQIDPCQSAADNYLLFGIANNSFVEIIKKYYPSDDEIATSGKLLGASNEEIQNRIKEIEELRNDDPTLKLDVLNAKAQKMFVELVERLDVSFREYVHMACGGELRHMSAMKGDPHYAGERRRAWAQWFFIYEKYGPKALKQMSHVFRTCGGGSFGGEKWALGSDILYQREVGELGPDEFSNKQVFVDRVFTLEHNGGCFLNKLGWVNLRKDRPNAMEHFGAMKNNVLKAHCANPVDIKKLYDYASEEVQKLLKEYLDLAVQYGLEINGIWLEDNKPKLALPVTIKNEEEASAQLLDWSSVEDDEDMDEELEELDCVEVVGNKLIALIGGELCQSKANLVAIIFNYDLLTQDDDEWAEAYLLDCLEAEIIPDYNSTAEAEVVNFFNSYTSQGFEIQVVW